MLLRLYLICLVDAILAETDQKSGIIVKIRNGTIRGRVFTSLQNKTIYAFQEIPYAKPPVGKLRFKDPLSAENWSGILNTTKNTKICWETRINENIDDPRQSEDCLYLNVYIPKPPGLSKELLPVWVYIYGGRFLFGDGTYKKNDPQLFVDYGVIAVTMNYRSGPLGFLTTEDGVIPANLGLKDQNLALKWIQENIEFFGGDPSKVTLNGQSSGAVNICHHFISEKANGLFRAAIIQSGVGISPTSITKRARYFAYEIGKLLSPNFSKRNSSQELLELLQKTSARVITNADFPHLSTNNTSMQENFAQLRWMPVIERADIPNAYLIRLPYNSFLTGNYQKVPILIGITSEEGLYYDQELSSWAAHMGENTISLENNNVKWGFRKHLEKCSEEIYTSTSFQHDENALMRYISDYIFSTGVIRFADLHSRFANTYFYKFSYYGKMNKLCKPHRINVEGLGNVGHTEDLPYIIFYPGRAADLHQYPEMDRLIQLRTVKLWTNFVKYLNPTPKSDPLVEYKKWPRLSRNNFSYLDINTNLTVIRGYPRSFEKWIPLLNDYYEHPLSIM